MPTTFFAMSSRRYSAFTPPPPRPSLADRANHMMRMQGRDPQSMGNRFAQRSLPRLQTSGFQEPQWHHNPYHQDVRGYAEGHTGRNNFTNYDGPFRSSLRQTYDARALRRASGLDLSGPRNRLEKIENTARARIEEELRRSRHW